MKFLKTGLIALAVLAFAGGVYYYTVIKEEKNKQLLEFQNKVIKLEKDQINYFEIQNKETRFVFLKNEKGWNIQEPVVDSADSDQIAAVLEQLTNDSLVDIAKEFQPNETVKWDEFGLSKPEHTIIIKNNLGRSQKIIISEMKNFEGNYYARVDSENKILLVKPFWYEITTKKIVYFRDKKLYRFPVSLINKISVSALNDEFVLVKKDNNWESEEFPEKLLDQNRVRQIIKNISEINILDYIFEGEPSQDVLKEKHLDKNFVTIQFEANNVKWGVKVNLHDEDKVLYALTDRPTFLVSLEPTKWELFANLNLDSLRDRKSLMKFKLDEVKSIFYKNGKDKFEFIKNGQTWKLKQDAISKIATTSTTSKVSQTSAATTADNVIEKNEVSTDDSSSTSNVKVDSRYIDEVLERINNFELTYFLEEKDAQAFNGQDMIILKSDTGQLLFQFNWGPLVRKKVLGSEKEFFLARTQVSDIIFGFDKEDIEKIDFKKAIKN